MKITLQTLRNYTSSKYVIPIIEAYILFICGIFLKPHIHFTIFGKQI